MGTARVSRGALGIALVLVACAGGGAGRRAPARAETATKVAEAAREPAPVVVAIEVDQLSAWVAASRWPELPGDGGFARLRREGTWVKNVRYPYASTDTAPGHASLHTGRVPAETGIFANEVPVAPGERASILRDDATRLVAPGGVSTGSSAGSSAARLRVDTVADRLRRAHPGALVVSVSLKDRGAILPAGHHPTHAIWFDTHLGAFVTSTAFASALPEWVAPLGGPRAVAAAMKAPWEPTSRAWLASHAATADDAPGEGDLDGLGTTFPHVARTSAAFRALPASDAMIFRLALAAVEHERAPARPTLLLLSLTASDVVGHTFGPDSWEAWDHLRKLDASLGAFLTALDGLVGRPVRVLLTADHGNVPMPEVPNAARPWCTADGHMKPDPFARPCAGGERLGLEDLGRELRAAAKKALGPGDYVLGVADPYVYLTDKARGLDPSRRTALDAAIRAALARHRGVAEVYDVRELAARCPSVLASARPVPARALPGEDVLTLVCRSYSPAAKAGDYYVVPKPGSFFDAEIVHGKGTSHGTPYLHDRTVALLARGSGLAPGAVVDAPVDFSVVAALEASFVGLDATPPAQVLAAHTAR